MRTEIFGTEFANCKSIINAKCDENEPLQVPTFLNTDMQME